MYIVMRRDTMCDGGTPGPRASTMAQCSVTPPSVLAKSCLSPHLALTPPTRSPATRELGGVSSQAGHQVKARSLSKENMFLACALVLEVQSVAQGGGAPEDSTITLRFTNVLRASPLGNRREPLPS